MKKNFALLIWKFYFHFFGHENTKSYFLKLLKDNKINALEQNKIEKQNKNDLSSKVTFLFIMPILKIYQCGVNESWNKGTWVLKLIYNSIIHTKILAP